MPEPNECDLESLGIRDRFHRRIEYLRISVTDRCDLRCRYCGGPAGGDGRIDPDRWLGPAELGRFVRAAVGAGLRRVRLTGGEPLLRPEILEIVAAVKTAGVRDLSLTTNGQRLAAMAGPLRRAGLDRVNVSLDSLRPERYRAISRGGDLGRVLDGMAAAEAAGLYPLKINMVPMRNLNDDEVEDFARITVDRDCHVRFIECMPVEGAALRGSEHPKAGEIMAKVARLGRLHRLEFRGGGPSRNYRLVGARGVIGFISPITDHFCGSCNRLRMTVDGRLRPCLFSAREIDAGALLRRNAPRAALAARLEEAVLMKPERHLLSEGEGAHLPTMSDIGG